ncbi:MAG: glycosyltransferase [Alphaproteobacteria bacterium]|nr:glycosyltransferase [Alphaproteobacteria bacterium]
MPHLVDLILPLAALCLAVWIYMVLQRGQFWRSDQRLEATEEPAVWPKVVAIVPARNEAKVIARSMASLLDQDYPGEFRIVLVDDNSEDGTAQVARSVLETHNAGERLNVVGSTPLPPGWVGKMWALQNGIRHAKSHYADTDYMLLTDADIVHDPSNLRRLVAKAQAEGLHLVSLMVKLHCSSLWERLLIPTFVYFFQKLYPFRWVNDPADPTAGAAGGCMLVRSDALHRAGGVASVRAEIIDDCALAKRIKKYGPIWLGLTETEHSIRPYDGLADIWRMIARTAYTQLDRSPVILAGTFIGMLLTYLAAPGIVLTYPLHHDWGAANLAGIAWLLMAASFWPTARLYRVGPWWTPLVPLAAIIYVLATLDSARLHWQGRGGNWKGRSQANVTEV